VERSPNHVVVMAKGVLKTFVLKLVIPFDSARKMMSVIVKDPEGYYHIYVKGAEVSMLPRLKLIKN
jgi:magnesium-transporting ATPase (P-type)